MSGTPEISSGNAYRCDTTPKEDSIQDDDDWSTLHCGRVLPMARESVSIGPVHGRVASLP